MFPCESRPVHVGHVDEALLIRIEEPESLLKAFLSSGIQLAEDVLGEDVLQDLLFFSPDVLQDLTQNSLGESALHVFQNLQKPLVM